MGLSDILNAKKLREENEQLKKMITPEMQTSFDLSQHIESQDSSATAQQSFTNYK